MPETPDSSASYRVSYSERVRSELKKLLARAKAHAMFPTVLAAVKEMDRRLHIYPQFGEPLRDLVSEPGKLWIGVVGPLVVRYVLLDDERRLVVIAVPIQTLPNCGLDP